MLTGQSNPKPHEGNREIGQPVHPAQILFSASIPEQMVHPYMEAR